MKGKCESKYKYKVIHSDEDMILGYYYFSMIHEIVDKFDISKSTIYKIINKQKTKFNNKYTIEKINKPKYIYTEISYN